MRTPHPGSHTHKPAPPGLPYREDPRLQDPEERLGNLGLAEPEGWPHATLPKETPKHSAHPLLPQLGPGQADGLSGGRLPLPQP